MYGFGMIVYLNVRVENRKLNRDCNRARAVTEGAKWVRIPTSYTLCVPSGIKCSTVQ